MSDAIAEFAFSPRSKISFWIDVFVESLLACLFLSGATFGIVNASNALILTMALVALYIGVVFASRVLLRLKYQYILNSDYTVSRDGIAVQQNGAREFFEWDRFTIAEYLPLVPLYRLRIPGMSKPVVLLALGGWRPGNKEDRRRNLLKTFLMEGLKSRLKTRWIPW